MADPRLHSTLYRRLVDIMALEPGDPFTEESAGAAIRGYCEGAVCCRWPPVDGKVRTFEAVFQAVFEKKLDGSAIKKRAEA